MSVKTIRTAMAITLMLLVLGSEAPWAGEAYWVLETSDPSGRVIEVVTNSGNEPATWQVDWVNYVKMIAGPFARREDATARCLEASERAGNYYQRQRCE